MKVEELFEAPQLIGDTDFGLDNPTRNSNTARFLLAKSDKHELETLNKDVSLWKINNRIALIDKNKMKVLYFSGFKDVWIGWLKTHATQQYAVWANKKNISSKGVAEHVFNHILLPITGTMISDGQQTDWGRDFWYRRMTEAWRDGHHVYYVHLMGPQQLIEIFDEEDLDKKQSKIDIWGDASKHQPRRVMISMKEIKDIVN